MNILIMGYLFEESHSDPLDMQSRKHTPMTSREYYTETWPLPGI